MPTGVARLHPDLKSAASPASTARAEIRHNEHRRHRSLGQAAPLKPLPDAVVDLHAFRARRRDVISGVMHEYAQVA